MVPKNTVAAPVTRPVPPINEDLLTALLSCPTAPYRETRVREFILKTLAEGFVPHFTDPVGNIVVGARSKAEYLKLIRSRDKEPLRVFVAHMDHPGFHGVKWNSPVDLEVKWYGGAPTHHLEGQKVWLTAGDSWSGIGRIASATPNVSGTSISSALIRLDEDPARTGMNASIAPEKLYGGFAFRAPIWKEGDLIYTRAADDLVGCYSILSLALELFQPTKGKRKSPPLPFLGIFTRAEEVGFIGAIGHLELGWLKKARRSLVIVSLETSRTLPGAEIGKGPVVRLGDRFTVFNAAALRVFAEVAEKALPGKYQKRVMDGGTCEASAFTVYGHDAIGISIPLGNYHNQGFQGGPDAAAPPSETPGAAPEFVHLQDVVGMLELCRALLQPKLPWSDPWKPKLESFKKSFREARTLLRAGRQ